MKLFENKKKIVFILLPFFILFGGGLFVKNNLPKVLEVILKIAVGPTISTKEIKFPKFGEIDVEGLIISEKGEELVSASEVKLIYSKESLKKFRLKEIIVENPDVFIKRDGSNVNIVEAFSSGGGDGIAGANTPIDLITVSNGKLIYKDITYSREIIKKVKDVNGYVTFNKKTGIDLEFSGKSGTESFLYKFNNSKDPLNMDIILRNIQINSDLIQYGYDDPKLSEASGIFNMDLKITSKELLGEATLKNGTLIYDDLDGEITNINGDIKFLKEGIFVDFDTEFDGSKGKFSVVYKEETGVNVDIKINDIPYMTVAKYKTLGELKLPLNNLILENTHVNLFYKSDLGFKATVLYKGNNFNIGGLEVEGLNGKVEYKDDILTLSGDNIKLFYKDLGLTKVLTYNTDLDLGKDDLLFDFKSNYLNLNGIFKKKDKSLEIQQGKEKALIYNLEKNSLDYLNLNAENILGNYKLNIKGNEKNKILNLESLTFKDDKGDIKFCSTGELNKENLKYKFYLKTNNLEEKEFFSQFKTIGKLTFDGMIEGEKDKFILQGNLKDFSVDIKDGYLSSYAKIFIVKDKSIEGSLDGEIRKIEYKNFNLGGIKIKTLYKDDELKIVDFRNNFFKINGDIDLKNQMISTEFSINNFTSDRFEEFRGDLKINKAKGNISGELKSPKAKLDIEDSYFELSNNEKIYLKGSINLNDMNVEAKNFNINNSLASFNYKILDKKGDFVLDILEENLSKYYSYNKLRYRALSRIKGRVDSTNINIDADLNLDRVYFSGKQLPNFKARIEYMKNDEKNQVNIKFLDVLNLHNKKLLTSSGYVDLLNKDLEYIVQKQRIFIKDLEGIIPTKDLEGDFFLRGDIQGQFNNINYEGEISKGKVSINGFEFNGIELLLKGDRNGLNISDTKIIYEGNQIDGYGNYIFSTEEYDFSLKSKEIDLSFLNLISQNTKVKDVSGKGEINLRVSSNDKKNIGYIKLSNVDAKIPEAYLDLKDFNVDIGLTQETINLKGLTGILNGGTVKGKGILKVPSLEEISENSEFYKDLNYSVYLGLDGVNYGIKDYFKLNLSSNIGVENNEIKGNVIINTGEITGILHENKGLIEVIIKTIIDKTRSLILDSKKMGEKFEIKNKLETTPEFDLSVLIKDGIKINIPEVSSFAQDVKGVIQGRATITGKDNDILVLGEVEIQNGSFSLGDQDFVVTRAIVLSDQRNGYLSDFNPNIVLEMSSLDTTSRLDISILGELDNLTLNIATDQARESSSLKDIFLGESGTGNRDAVATLFKTIIDSQISSTILRPISKTIKDVLHISKLRIVSDIFNQEVLVNSDGERKEDSNLLGFGAYLEAEDPIYKDKYYWVARIGIVDGTKDESDSTQKTGGRGVTDTVNQFDFKVERRYKSGWSYGIGVAKLNDNYTVKEENQGKLNYYIDFKFERKYNSIKDIFFNEK